MIFLHVAFLLNVSQVRSSSILLKSSVSLLTLSAQCSKDINEFVFTHTHHLMHVSLFLSDRDFTCPKGRFYITSRRRCKCRQSSVNYPIQPGQRMHCYCEQVRQQLGAAWSSLCLNHKHCPTTVVCLHLCLWGI